MPLNQIKKYNSLLDIAGLSIREREISLKAVFKRDVADNTSFKFRAKQIQPTPKEGQLKLDILYAHLTTVVTDKKTRKREYDIHRSKRLHWLKHHLEENMETVAQWNYLKNIFFKSRLFVLHIMLIFFII